MKSPSDQDRYLVINGRRWRRADPALSPDIRDRLVHELMDARRAVNSAKRDEDATAERAARARVHDAKVALGERGVPWWVEPTPSQRAQRNDAMRRALRRGEPRASDGDLIQATDQ